MDEQRFDAALRALHTATTRRAGIAAAVAALLGGAAVRAVMEGASAGGRDNGGRRRRNRPGTAGPCGDGARKDNTCTTDKECCTGICNLKTGKRNRDGKGRCRCLRRGSACKTGKNCCSPMSCVSGVCRASGGGCTSNSECTGATDTCTSGTCTCGGGTACSGGTPICDDGSCRAAVWKNQTTFGTGGSDPGNFSYPQGVAVSPDGLTAWIADQGNSRISIWTRPDAGSTAWTNQTTFGTSGSGASNFSDPHGVAVSPDGLTAWIADTQNSRISIWTRPDAGSTAWTNQTTFGSSGSNPGELLLPQGVFASADGLTAWVADTDNRRISIWTRPDAGSTAWTNQTTFGIDGSAFFFTSGVFASPDGLTTWVSHKNNNRISIWTRPDAGSTAWTNLTTFGSEGPGSGDFSYPQAVVVSVDGLTMWIADSGNNRISIWTRPDAGSTAWTNLTTFGTPGSDPGNFSNPNDVVVSADGLTAWIADTSNHRVSIWTKS